MPCHLTTDAHELVSMNWLTRFPLPYLLSSETTAMGTAMEQSAGKEDPVELDSS